MVLADMGYVSLEVSCAASVKSIGGGEDATEMLFGENHPEGFRRILMVACCLLVSTF